jgi:hypothetical protein
MLEQFNKFLLDDKGEIRSFADFARQCDTVDVLYNKTYLEAEYETAIASAQMAEKWEGLSKFKLLEFSTTGGENVCPICGGFDRMIIASNDPILNRICPPLHFKCHCTLIPAAESDTLTPRDHIKDVELAAGIKPYFKNNPGKSKVIYKEDHPYFKNGRYGKLKELDAEKNYGMPGVAQIYKMGDFPPINYTADKTSALEWWMQQTGGDVRGSFDIEAADGITVRFDNAFRNHVLEQNADDRYMILSKATDVIKAPDEIWSRIVKGKPSLTYIKYYDKSPIVVQVDAHGTVRSSTMVEMQHGKKINIAEMIKLRKGILKFKQ